MHVSYQKLSSQHTLTPGSSALEWAWTKILGNSFSPEATQEMEDLFNDRDCLEEMGFTYLHKIVLGLHGQNLDAHLEGLSMEAQNAQDFTRRTALSWAAQRGDWSTLMLLLNHGVDPNIFSKGGHAPLHYTAEARTARCIQPRLNCGAEINSHDIEGQSPLHYASKHCDSLEYYKLLIAAGADVSELTRYGISVLATALGRERHSAIRLLLDHGASVNQRGQNGKTPIFYAVDYNAHESLSILRDRGADFSPEIDLDPTIVH